MPSSIQVNLVDRSRERTAVRIPTMPVISANMAALDAFGLDAAGLIEALSLLSVTGTSLNKVGRVSFELPTDDNAIREVAVRFILEDSEGNQASFSIGGPDLAVFPFTVGTGGDIYEWDSAAQSAALDDFVTSMLTVARHPITNDVLTMKRLELVGRNN